MQDEISPDFIFDVEIKSMLRAKHKEARLLKHKETKETSHQTSNTKTKEELEVKKTTGP